MICWRTVGANESIIIVSLRRPIIRIPIKLTTRDSATICQCSSVSGFCNSCDSKVVIEQMVVGNQPIS